MRILIANRGEIALRIARTATEMGIEPVGIHVDRPVLLPSAQVPSFLDGAAIVAAAQRLGAQLVHPGYGFLAENADFAQMAIDAGLTWVGPSPEMMRKLGSKLGSRQTALERGVPVVPDDGWPRMVKAALGGGGRGMRVVRSPEALEEALESARREALAAFGSDEVFTERLIEGARHVEVQILGDRHGRVVALGERDCSVQRRHQKIVEEAPSPGMDPALRARLCADAERLCAGYEGAGTVEFLVNPEGEHWLLEVNTRLQVEHPVTEAITGLDLVRYQIEIALGGHAPEPPALRGHAIEARLCAEGPDFLPRTGTIRAQRWPAGVRVDAGDGVDSRYDSLLAKIIAWGPTREEARRKLVLALRQTAVLGLETNRGTLQAILEHPDFRAGALHTRWLEAAAPAAAQPDPSLAARVAEALEGTRPRAALPGLPKGWSNNPWRPLAAPKAWRRGEELILDEDGLCRAFLVVDTPEGTWVALPEGDLLVPAPDPFPEPADAAVSGSLQAPMPGKVLKILVEAEQSVVAGQVLLVLEAMKMEQSVRAPAEGRVKAVRVAVGEMVGPGQILVELSAE